MSCFGLLAQGNAAQAAILASCQVDALYHNINKPVAHDRQPTVL